MQSVSFIAKADRSINFCVARHRALMVLLCRLILVPAVVSWHVHSYRKMHEWQAFLNYNLTFTELYGRDVHVYRGMWTCPEYLNPGSRCIFVLCFQGDVYFNSCPGNPISTWRKDHRVLSTCCYNTSSFLVFIVHHPRVTQICECTTWGVISVFRFVSGERTVEGCGGVCLWTGLCWILHVLYSATIVE